MIQINAFYSDRIRIELIFLNIHFKISKSWPIQYSLSIMPFITGSFGENFRSSDLDSRAEACPISNDGSRIATYLSNTFQIFSIINLWYVRFIPDFQIHDDLMALSWLLSTNQNASCSQQIEIRFLAILRKRKFNFISSYLMCNNSIKIKIKTGDSDVGGQNFDVGAIFGMLMLDDNVKR